VSWLNSLDLSKVSDEDRFRILEYAVSRHGRARVQEVLGVSRITMWRLLNKQVRVDDDKLRALLSLITQREFESLISAKDRLRALGVLREDGIVDYGLALEILALAKYGAVSAAVFKGPEACSAISSSVLTDTPSVKEAGGLDFLVAPLSPSLS